MSTESYVGLGLIIYMDQGVWSVASTKNIPVSRIQIYYPLSTGLAKKQSVPYPLGSDRLDRRGQQAVRSTSYTFHCELLHF
jgi:hypothetical protein